MNQVQLLRDRIEFRREGRKGSRFPYFIRALFTSFRRRVPFFLDDRFPWNTCEKRLASDQRLLYRDLSIVVALNIVEQPIDRKAYLSVGSRGEISRSDRTKIRERLRIDIEPTENANSVERRVHSKRSVKR